MIATRQMVLWGSLLATVAASIWAGSITETPDDAALVPRSAERMVVADRSAVPAGVAAPSALKNEERVPLALPLRTPGADPASELFAAYSWQPPKSAADDKARREPPPPPPLPFTFSGRIEIDGQPSFLFAEGQRTHIVPVGSEVGEFRLESASSAELVFLHIPTAGRIFVQLGP